ncbi:MAG TPA: 16S rRNA (uracil(1498)-N(3))-methyltransferase, partial [Firmicutes bacterium]|nr:16S rRNA (uracil(1498)-N(3))-methyltransferase [Bacillota bacterium]
EKMFESGEPTVKVTLAAAIIKADRFESLVEKATELGVDAVWPMESENSVVRAPSENKQRRWRAIAESAAGQCLRSRVPQIADPLMLDDVIARRGEFDAAFVAWERQRNGSLESATLDSRKRILLIVGPEGGFTPVEIARLESANVTPVTLGARRLRTVTAAITLLTLTMQWAGEFSRTAYGAIDSD